MENETPYEERLSTEVPHNVSEEDILKGDPPPQEVLTDTTWIRDELPSQALREF